MILFLLMELIIIILNKNILFNMDLVNKLKLNSLLEDSNLQLFLIKFLSIYKKNHNI
jgi:hypothetical protein